MTYRYWTTSEDRDVLENYPIHGGRAIAKRIGRSEAAVQFRAAKLGVRGPRRNIDYMSGELKQVLARISA